MRTPLVSHLLAQEPNAANHFWYRLRARAVVRFVPRHATVVDVGAGAGALGLILRKTRPDVTYRFREPEPELHALLARTFGDASNAPVGTEFAAPTTATVLDVVEHVQDDVALLRGLADELPAGSVVVVTVPALPLLWSTWDHTVGHYRRYRRKQISSVLEAAGLDVVATHYIFLELFPVAIARRVFRIDNGADFPQVSRWLNALLYAVGVATQKLGRVAPCGTSIVCAGVVRR